VIFQSHRSSPDHGMLKVDSSVQEYGLCKQLKFGSPEQTLTASNSASNTSDFLAVTVTRTIRRIVDFGNREGRSPTIEFETWTGLERTTRCTALTIPVFMDFVCSRSPVLVDNQADLARFANRSMRDRRDLCPQARLSSHSKVFNALLYALTLLQG
jgi:hypothetical protein